MKILVIDDEKLILWSFEKNLQVKGHEVFTAESARKGLDLFKNNYPDIVFLDNNLPQKKGLDLIPEIKEIYSETFIVFMTAYESVEIAVEAMKRGAVDYIRKPFNFEEINIIIQKISDRLNSKKELILLRRHQKEDTTFDHIVHQSVIMKEVVQISKRIAQTDATTILLLGESGTGKDIFARAIHNESSRNKSPFVTINCSSMPETLLDSELFGHEKGAFTDAKNMKKGLFEIAEGGTVFLDEIGEISQVTQLKLLGVLENRTIRKLGGTKEIPVDVRIIAATNKDLKASLEDNSFREDLFYRLQVFQIELPPLSKRKEDILPLIDFFINYFNKEFNKKISSISPKARKLLEEYNWPGNIRELRNVIERAVILQSGTILEPNTLPSEVNKSIAINKSSRGYLFDFPPEGISLEELEKQVIIQALGMAGQNKTEASRLLGISRDTLRYKKKKYRL